MACNGRPVSEADGSAAGPMPFSLLGRVKAREPEAWRELVARYGPQIIVWCRRSGLQPDDAADVTQEVFLAILRYVVGFRPNEPHDGFCTWLRAITKSKIANFFRCRRQVAVRGGLVTQQRLAQLPARPLEEAPSTAHCWPCPECEAMKCTQAGLEVRTWQAFWRVVVDEQPAAVVAQELCMSVHAVYDAKYRVQRQLRQACRNLAPCASGIHDAGDGSTACPGLTTDTQSRA